MAKSKKTKKPKRIKNKGFNIAVPSDDELLAIDSLATLPIYANTPAIVLLQPFLDLNHQFGYEMDEKTLNESMEFALQPADASEDGNPPSVNAFDDEVLARMLESMQVGILPTFQRVILPVDEHNYILVEDSGKKIVFTAYVSGAHDSTLQFFNTSREEASWVWRYTLHSRGIKLNLKEYKEHSYNGAELGSGKPEENPRCVPILMLKKYINAVNRDDVTLINMLRDMAKDGGYNELEIKILEDKSIKPELKYEMMRMAFFTDIIQAVMNYSYTLYFMAMGTRPDKISALETMTKKENKEVRNIHEAVAIVKEPSTSRRTVQYKVLMDLGVIYRSSATRCDMHVRRASKYTKKAWPVVGHFRKSKKTGKRYWVKATERERKKELLAHDATTTVGKDYIVK